jgi:hypothetical protein
MKVTMKRDLSRINSDVTVGYVHLSRTHGKHDIVPLDKRTIKALRMGHDELVIPVRNLEARRIVARGYDELRMPTSGKPGKVMSQAFSKQPIDSLHHKFHMILPNRITPESLMDELRDVDEGSYAYLAKAMDLLQSKVANIRGEPWIKINPSTMPMEIVSEDKVIEDLRQRCSMIPSLFYGVPTAAFGITAAVMLFNHFGNTAQTKCFFSALTVAFAIGACKKIFQYAKYTDHLKILESLPARKPADPI